MKYKGTTPCKSCPYRKDAPLQHWHKDHFKELLDNNQEQFGKIYDCHRNDGTVCKGWLMDQDKRRFPNINLRMSLTRHNVTIKYLDNLKCAFELFDSVEEMCYTNYPELKRL